VVKSKRQTTMAKLARERLVKREKKAARAAEAARADSPEEEDPAAQP
jgi:hypothetical protein